MRALGAFCLIALAGCGGGGASDGVKACVERWNSDTGTRKGASHIIGADHTGQGPRRLEIAARMAIVGESKCVLITPDEEYPDVFERQSERWVARDTSIGTASTELLEKARESDEGVDGIIVAYTDSLQAGDKPDSGRFSTD